MLESESAFQQYFLGNGLQVLLCFDHSLPVVTSMLWYRVGSADEQPGQTGHSHFLEHMLFKGTQRFGKGLIDSWVLSQGGSNNAFTFLDSTAYFFNLPAAHWRLALEIEADRMQGAVLDPAELEVERQVILEEWQTAQDDPEELIWDLVNSMALLRHPYRYPVLGWPEDIQACTPETLRAHYQRHYHPNHATLVLVGDLPEDALEQIEQTLGSLPAGPAAVPRRQLEEPVVQGQRRVSLSRQDIRLPRLLVAWPAPALMHPDYFPMLLLHYVLSEGWSSRLHQTLVEDLQQASGVVSLLFETRDPYLFWIQVDLNLGVEPQLLEDSLFADLQALRTGQISLQDVERARNQLLTDFYLNQETSEGRAEWAGEMVTSGHVELLQNYVPQIEAVGLEDVKRVAQRYLSPDLCTLGWLLPLAETSGAEDPEQEMLADTILPEPLGLNLPTTTSAMPESPWLTHAEPVVFCPDLSFSKQGLSNGLKLIHHANFRTPTFCLEFWLPAGAWHESEAQQGLASLCLASLLKGTQQRSARAFSLALENLGASLDVSCGLSGAILRIEALEQHLEPLLALLAETLQQAALPAAEVYKERQLMLTGLEQASESAAYQVGRAFLQKIYAGTPAAYASEGSAESLNSLGVEAVQAFYQQHYHPQGAWLSLAGAVTSVRFFNAARPLFEAWSSHDRVAHVACQPLKQAGFHYQHILLPQREQCTLVLGHLGVPRQSPDFAALLLLDIILGCGPGFASRIPRVLRDEQGLAYHVSYSATLGAHLYPGLVQAELECAPEKVLACVRGVVQEIRRVQSEGVRAAELEAAKAYILGHFVFLFETNAQRAGYLVQQAVFDWPENHLQRWTEAIAAVELASLQRVAQQYLDTQNYTLITAGPKLAWHEEDFREL